MVEVLICSMHATPVTVNLGLTVMCSFVTIRCLKIIVRTSSGMRQMAELLSHVSSILHQLGLCIGRSVALESRTEGIGNISPSPPDLQFLPNIVLARY